MSEHEGPIFAARKNLRVMGCIPCGFSHLYPLPSPESLIRLYRDEFWQREKPGAIRTIERQLLWWHTIWDLWLSEVGAPSTLIDMGSGFGHFAHFARALGWNAAGIEPSASARRFSMDTLGVPTFDLRIEDVLVDGSQVNLVTAFWVLEHLLDPKGFLNDLSWRVDSLLLAVPNEMTDLQRSANLVAKNRDWWVHPTHINYFNKASLNALLLECGWSSQLWMGTFPMENYIVHGEDYTDNPALGAECHERVRKNELEMPSGMLRELYLTRGKMGIGRDLVVLCRSLRRK